MNRDSAWICFLALAASPLAACGDDTAAGGGGGGVGGEGGGASADPLEMRWTSGSRLKIKVQRAGDAEQFAGVHDVELDAPCVILPAGDGSLRCVPSGQARVVYTDPDCTDAVATYY
ncbi:MAG: hypothetical protein JNK04_08855, partial [Myxococcales bacterium]|nr:hypothetical protein [Myxococcales bacterium]